MPRNKDAGLAIASVVFILAGLVTYLGDGEGLRFSETQYDVAGVGAIVFGMLGLLAVLLRGQGSR